MLQSDALVDTWEKLGRQINELKEVYEGEPLVALISSAYERYGKEEASAQDLGLETFNQAASELNTNLMALLKEAIPNGHQEKVMAVMAVMTSVKEAQDLMSEAVVQIFRLIAMEQAATHQDEQKAVEVVFPGRDEQGFLADEMDAQVSALEGEMNRQKRLHKQEVSGLKQKIQELSGRGEEQQAEIRTATKIVETLNAKLRHQEEILRQKEDQLEAMKASQQRREDEPSISLADHQQLLERATESLREATTELATTRAQLEVLRQEQKSAEARFQQAKEAAKDLEQELMEKSRMGDEALSHPDLAERASPSSSLGEELISATDATAYQVKVQDAVKNARIHAQQEGSENAGFFISKEDIFLALYEKSSLQGNAHVSQAEKLALIPEVLEDILIAVMNAQMMRDLSEGAEGSNYYIDYEGICGAIYAPKTPTPAQLEEYEEIYCTAARAAYNKVLNAGDHGAQAFREERGRLKKRREALEGSQQPGAAGELEKVNGELRRLLASQQLAVSSEDENARRKSAFFLSFMPGVDKKPANTAAKYMERKKALNKKAPEEHKARNFLSAFLSSFNPAASTAKASRRHGTRPRR